MRIPSQIDFQRMMGRGAIRVIYQPAEDAATKKPGPLAGLSAGTAPRKLS